MSGKVVVVVTLAAALLASSASSAPGESNVLQKLLVKERMRETARGQEPAPQTVPARTERRAHLSEDEREIMTKQIVQAISEMMNSECVLSRDYQGWVDFGRRDAQ